MGKLAVRLMGVSLLLGMGLAATPAFAQDTGVANTAEDFKSADAQDGFLGTGTSIWDIMQSAGRLSSGAGQVDESFYRSQSRIIHREADSLRARQQAILDQQAAEANAVDAAVAE